MASVLNEAYSQDEAAAFGALEAILWPHGPRCPHCKTKAREARLMTDEAGGYRVVGQHFAKHGVVRHGREEYVHPDDPTIHTNTAEGYFSIFKRGMKGIYQHCSERHLHRYVAEFDFRYNNRIAKGIDDA